jgi:hypothetical protein
MIRYQLRCSHGHGFEGWFRSSGAFDEEVQALTCPICDDPLIAKAIMAPAVQLRGDKAQAARAAPESPAPSPASVDPATGRGSETPPATAPVAALPPAPLPPEQVQLAKALTLMRKLRAHVEANFENVGRRFAEEARKIHHEEADPRGIYGEASRDEVESLEEEGIRIAPLPNLPKLDG